MTKFSYAFLLVLLAGGCSTQIGGEGQLSTGEPLSVVMQIDMNAVDAVSTLDILSLDGWSCKATFTDSKAGNGPRQVHPLTCSDGAKGQIVSTWDQIQKRHIGAFKLDDGRSGRVTFNYKS